MLFVSGVFLLLLISVGVFISLFTNRSVGVEELWKKEYENRKLEGMTVIVRGDILFEPLSDFQFNDIYLVDTETPSEHRTTSYAFWFGIGIEGVSCTIDTIGNLISCEPFDPTKATAFEFKGTIHLDQVGKKEIMWLSDIDFEHSHQLIDGEWQPIPLGEFVIPLEKD